MSGVAKPRVGDLVLPPSCGVPSAASPGPAALLPSASPPPGLALMMQLARELKTLARDLGVAVLVRKWAWPPLLVLSLAPGLDQGGT